MPVEGQGAGVYLLGAVRTKRTLAANDRSPGLKKPTGSVFNEVRFDRVKAGKVRVVFTHAGKARSGVSELFVWNE